MKTKAEFVSGKSPLRQCLWTVYRQEIERIPLLTREEEMELARRSSGGDFEARNKLVHHNLRFVVSRVKFFVDFLYITKAIGFEDLFQVGAMALIRAAKNYKPREDAKFVSYAVVAIDNEIWGALDRARFIRINPKVAKLIKAYKRVESILAECEELEEPPLDEVALRMDVEFKEALEIRSWGEMRKVERLESFSSEEQGAVEYHIEGEVFCQPDKSADHKCMADLLPERIAICTRRPAMSEALERFWGLNGREKEDHGQICDEFRVGRERMRQILVSYTRRLRNDLVINEMSGRDPYAASQSRRKPIWSRRDDW